MVIDIKEVVDGSALSNRYILRDGFSFTAILHPGNVYDALIIKYPPDARCFSPRIQGSLRSIEEQIEFINSYKIEKALIIADSLDFITRCPSLKYMWIVPADSAGDGFDYSPLYKMPQIKQLRCSTVYGFREEFSTYIDYAKINGLESINVTNDKYRNYTTIDTLKRLGLSDYPKKDLTEAFSSSMINTLLIIQSRITTLEGIQKSKKMQCLYLYYNRSLQDISALREVKGTLRALRIESSSKIKDFSVLGELENLELLELWGSNELPDLSFLKKMKSLKTFIFNVNVLDGDLTPCLDLSYVYSDRNRKHYNLKDADLPKKEYVHGNENLEEWLRLE